jgi:drug/metabolite transporter (DMT)-like permease
MAFTPEELGQIRAAVREEVIHVLRWPLVILGVIGIVIVTLIGGIGGLLVVGAGLLFAGLVVAAVLLQKKCPACKGTIKDDATACPHCGQQIPS